MSGRVADATGVGPLAIIGPYGPAQIGVLRGWRDRGWPAVFIHLTDGAPLRWVPRKLAGYHRMPPGVVGSAEGTARLRELLSSLGVAGIAAVSYTMTKWLAETVAGTGCVAMGASPDCIAFLNSKGAQIDLAHDIGFGVLRSWRLTSREDGPSVPTDAFPLVLRPDRPGSARPNFKVELMPDAAALDRFLAEQTAPSFGIVAQPFVLGPNLVVHGVRHVDGRTKPHAGFLVDYKYQGVTQRLVPTQLDPAFEAQCTRFIERAGLTGVYHFEFLIDAATGERWFLEINGRFGGTTGKVYRCGYPEAANLAEAFGLIEWNPDNPQMQPIAVSNARSLYSRLRSLSRGAGSPLDYPLGPGLRRKLIAGLVTWTDEIASRRHPDTMLDYYREGLGL